MMKINKSVYLDIKNHLIVKKTNPLSMKIEYKKHTTAYKLTLKCNLFKVPKIYYYDSRKGVINMEYFSSLQSFSSFKNPTNEMVIKIANSLSYIHENLILKKKINSTSINNIGIKYKTFIHGDFNGKNVCVDNKGNIIILDWQTAKIFGGKATYQSRLFDVLWFATYSLRVPQKKDLNFLRTIRISKLFIDSYMNASKRKIDPSYFYNYTRVFILNYLKNKKKMKKNSIKEILAFKYSIFLNLFFLRSLKKFINNE